MTTQVDHRFAFGENWSRFLARVDENRVSESQRALLEFLGNGALDGRSLLDLGCGSGLSSLAALRAGASRVHSVDYDPKSVESTRELKRRFAPSAVDWSIEMGDATDARWMASLGTFDIVYSWGVLHHTGAMWRALDLAIERVAPGGTLFVAIYNDQGLRSRVWHTIKRNYGAVPPPLRPAYVGIVMAPRELLSLAAQTAAGHPRDYLRSWTEYAAERGMSRWHDLVDWVGGYPFEVATPEAVFDACCSRGLTLRRMTTCRGGLGCNQFVFEDTSQAVAPATR